MNYNRRYYLTHRAELLLYYKQYHIDHRETQIARAKKYQEEHPIQHRLACVKYQRRIRSENKIRKKRLAPIRVWNLEDFIHFSFTINWFDNYY